MCCPKEENLRETQTFSQIVLRENEESETKKGICPRICPGLDEAKAAEERRLRVPLRYPSCGLLLRQAMERAETQHQINGMDAHYYTILE